MSLMQARQLGLENFAVLVSHVTVPPPSRRFFLHPPAVFRAFWPPVTSAR